MVPRFRRLLSFFIVPGRTTVATKVGEDGCSWRGQAGRKIYELHKMEGKAMARAEDGAARLADSSWECTVAHTSSSAG